MKRERILSALLSVMMIFTIITPFSVLAEEDTPTITIQSVSDTAGATVNVDVALANNPGIMGATLKLTYDAGLTLVDATSGDAFSALVMTKPGKLVSPCKFVWDGQEISTEDIKDGTILTLQFKIDENAVAGDEYEIKLESDGIQDMNVNSVNVTIENGTVSVVDYLPGDLNGDNKVNSGDIILLRRHVAGGYEQTINEAACDVNNDGKKNSGDIILVRRYVAGGYDVVLKPSGPQCSHTMTATPYKAPNCTEDGNIAYWSCSKCNKLFSDANGTSVISLSSTVLAATGHTVVIDPAVEATYDNPGLTEGKHCSVCSAVIVEQTVIPKLEKDEYAITYHIHNNDNYLESIAIENPNPASYSKEDGLVLQDLIVKGYNFVGWFTAQTGGTKVTEIPVGTTGAKTLYAHWEKAEYTVQFESDMVPQTSFTYTTGQEMTLPKPVLDKYTFVGWCDKDGQMWETIPAGTSQDLILYANWSSNRNQAIPVDKLADPIICEDSEAGLILFTYEIGEIKNVPLFTILNLNCANGIITTSSKTETEEISSTSAKTIAETISNATTNSASWTLESNWNNTTEVSQTYLDQTNQTREEAESLAKSETGTYNLSSSSGGSTQNTSAGTKAYKLSKNKANSDTTTTETGQNFDLSVDAKYSSEMSVGASIPIEVVNLDVGAKSGFEIGAGVDYGNYVKNTDTGTKSWSKNLDISKERSKTTTAEKNWNTSEGYSNSQSTSTNTSVSNAVSKLISQEYGYGSSYAEGGSNSEAQAIESTDSKSNEFSSTLTYYTSKIVSTTTSYESTGHTNGGYRLVMAGTVHVFAVVGYNVAENTYFVYTYNVLDEKTEEYLDYSYNHSFNDYETSIIPFEIPHFVNDYVNSRIAKTSGLQIDPDTGIIEEYTTDSENPDTIVIIPSYISVYNGDGTYTSVKVKGIREGLFKDNTDIKGVKLGNFITEIPDSVFDGCSSLEYVVTPGVTKIGDNAFAGCISLDEFILPADVTEVGENAFEGVPKINAVAANADVAQAVATSGAENIVLDISGTDMSDAALEVGEITSFELLGKNKEYAGLSVKSDAETTVINGVNFTDCKDIPMELSSENVTLNRVTADAQGFALVMTADNTDVKLNQNVALTSALGNAVLCKDVSFSSLTTSVVGKMTLSGEMLVAGDTVDGESRLTFNSGEIKYITDEAFESYRTSCPITFDANGGSVDTTTKSVKFNTAIGELPTPTYGDYTFLGWYTEKNGGTKITTDTVITSASGITAYAKWNNWDGTSTEPAYDSATKTYTITNGNELRWVSGVSRGNIISGENLPSDVTFNGYIISLANDIYLNDVSNWQNWDTTKPTNQWNTTIFNFYGTFNGNGHYIYGQYGDSLFVSNSGTIKNLNLSKGYSQYAALLALNYGTVTNCKSSIKTANHGVIGRNVGTVSYCGNTEKINGVDYINTGGIVGENEGIVKYCYNTGNISGSLRVGGIVGLNSEEGEVKYCYNTGNISGSLSVGGIAGRSIGVVEFCYNNGSVNATNDYAGGIVGELYKSTIANCHNQGRISSAAWSGGIAGEASNSDLLSCYNFGNVTSEEADCAGGVVGTFWSNYANQFKYCYTDSNYAPVYAHFPSGDEIEMSSITSMSASSLKSGLRVGISSSYWAIDSNINNGYPYLKALKDTY